ncbi:hypothetical protein ONZ43_g446 [Nemania bipapillata]|uniref:Uncharacterized protein n=1 Tax=Nemania bipapillata TaxID=110536 RepID=A0ACC2J878_9PEZI|nr:hypothetical protein ONZ43_g446 [Nemania bipapillata]
MENEDKSHVTLKFTTFDAEFKSAFGVGDSIVSAQVSNPGLVDAANTMVLALTTTSKTLMITVADLLKMA